MHEQDSEFLHNLSPLATTVVVATAAIGVAGASTLLWGHLHEADNLEVVRTRVDVEGWPREADGYRIGFLSDFHVFGPRDSARAERALDLLLTEKPDIVLFGGDYLNHKTTRNGKLITKALHKAASCPGGAYAVMGNHDWESGRIRTLTSYFKEQGIVVLSNDAVPMPGAHGAWVVGVDCVYEERDDLAQAVRNVPAGAPKVMIVHEPDFADRVDIPITLQISGHAHGGQMLLPGLPRVYMPPLGKLYPEGLMDHGPHLVYTSRGVGMTRLPFRLFCRPEVTVLDMYAK